jgi:hypothetical protein
MTVEETVTRYYDAWQNKHGDFTDVPLSAVVPARPHPTTRISRAMPSRVCSRRSWVSMKHAST